MVPIQKVRRFKLRKVFSHSRSFQGIAAIPSTLGRSPLYLRDQKTSNFCTSAARSVAGSYLFGRDMSFEYQTAKEGQVAGAPIFNGADPAKADTASEEYGFLPSEQSPLSFALNGWQTPAEWQQYPSVLDGQAAVNTGFTPYNVYPDYDSIKAALISGQTDNSVVIANGYWFASWNQSMGGIIPTPADSPITRHSYLFIDFKTFPDGVERLVAQLSQGNDFGDDGLLYFSKDAVNTAFKNPMLNGLGCTIYRKSSTNPVQTQISKLQQVIQLCGELLTLLKLKV